MTISALKVIWGREGRFYGAECGHGLVWSVVKVNVGVIVDPYTSAV